MTFATPFKAILLILLIGGLVACKNSEELKNKAGKKVICEEPFTFNSVERARNNNAFNQCIQSAKDAGYQ